MSKLHRLPWLCVCLCLCVCVCVCVSVAGGVWLEVLHGPPWWTMALLFQVFDWTPCLNNHTHMHTHTHKQPDRKHSYPPTCTHSGFTHIISQTLRGSVFALTRHMCVCACVCLSQVIWPTGLQLQTVWNVETVVGYTPGLRGQGKDIQLEQNLRKGLRSLIWHTLWFVLCFFLIEHCVRWRPSTHGQESTV